MQKLLNAYRADPTLKNADKLRAYDLKHPFGSCMLTREDGELLNDAIHRSVMSKP